MRLGEGVESDDVPLPSSRTAVRPIRDPGGGFIHDKGQSISTVWVPDLRPAARAFVRDDGKEVGPQKSRSAYQVAGWTPGKRSLSRGRKQGRDFSLEYQVFSAGYDAQVISPK